jgi:hypothetical protein
MTKEKRKKLYALLEQWTRAEVMARVGDVAGLGYADYYLTHIELEDGIRKLMFGTSDLVELGKKFKLPLIQDLREKKRKKTHGKEAKSITNKA